MYLCGLKALSQLEGWEDGWEAFCHHRLAAAWRTYHDDVVAAGSRHFHGALYGLLSFDVGEVELEMALLLVEYLSCVDKFGLCLSSS